MKVTVEQFGPKMIAFFKEGKLLQAYPSKLFLVPNPEGLDFFNLDFEDGSNLHVYYEPGFKTAQIVVDPHIRIVEFFPDFDIEEDVPYWYDFAPGRWDEVLIHIRSHQDNMLTNQEGK